MELLIFLRYVYMKVPCKFELASIDWRYDFFFLFRKASAIEKHWMEMKQKRFIQAMTYKWLTECEHIQPIQYIPMPQIETKDALLLTSDSKANEKVH